MLCLFPTIQRLILPQSRSAVWTGGSEHWMDKTAPSSPSSPPPTCAGEFPAATPGVRKQHTSFGCSEFKQNWTGKGCMCLRCRGPLTAGNTSGAGNHDSLYEGPRLYNYYVRMLSGSLKHFNTKEPRFTLRTGSD